MDPVFSSVLRATLALLFASALVHKLRDFPRFVANVEDYEVAPRAFAGWIACAVAAGEAGATGALVLGGSFAPLVGLALLAAYSTAIGVNLARGRRDIDCGCSGPGGHRIGPGLLARNGLIGFAALLALVPATDRPLGALDVASIGFAVAFATFAWSAAGQLAAHPPSSSRERIPT